MRRGMWWRDYDIVYISDGRKDGCILDDVILTGYYCICCDQRYYDREKEKFFGI